MTVILKCPAWKEVWQRMHSKAPLLTSVFPPSENDLMWWTSQRWVGIEQPGFAHPRSRAAIARFYPLLKKRRRCPRSRGWVLPPMTRGSIRALQAMRLAAAAEMYSPCGVSPGF